MRRHAFEIIENDDAGLLAKVVDLIERPEQALELPVDIRGTDLQTRVWEALQTVPAGTTMNYTFLAEQIGGNYGKGILDCVLPRNY